MMSRRSDQFSADNVSESGKTESAHSRDEEHEDVALTQATGGGGPRVSENYIILTEVDGERRLILYWFEGDTPAKVVGRDAACDYVLNNPKVSNKHAMFMGEASGLYLLDCNSRNGTSLNGTPLKAFNEKPPFHNKPGGAYKAGPLQVGDRIVFGRGVATLDVHGMAAEGPGGMVFVVSELVGRVGSGTRTNKDKGRKRGREDAWEAGEGEGDVAEGAGGGGGRGTGVDARSPPARGGCSRGETEAL